MSDAGIADALLEQLRRFDTPTVCNAIEVIVPERVGFGFTTTPFVAARPQAPPMVGYARTVAIQSAQPNRSGREEAQKLRFAYFDYVAAGPRPAIVVMQDIDAERAGFGCYWGEVHTAIHKALGCAGAVTNGSMRDIEAVAEGFQLLAGSVTPSRAHAHILGFGERVNVGGMTVQSGDLIHADVHGAVVVPREAVDKLAAAVDLISRRERTIIDACRGDGFTPDRLKQAIVAAARIT